MHNEMNVEWSTIWNVRWKVEMLSQLLRVNESLAIILSRNQFEKVSSFYSGQS